MFGKGAAPIGTPVSVYEKCRGALVIIVKNVLIALGKITGVDTLCLVLIGVPNDRDKYLKERLLWLFVRHHVTPPLSL